jgi:tetratricopeptide (TPR) repeat protein
MLFIGASGMEKKLLNIELDELVKKYNAEKIIDDKVDLVEKIKELLENYLKEFPRDLEVLFKLSLTFFLLEDIVGSIECMEGILRYEPSNELGFILLAWFYVYGFFVLPAEVLKQVNDFNSKNIQLMSMLEYIKYRHYLADGNQLMQKKSLKKSIEYCSEFVWNHKDLAEIYICEKQYDKAYPLIIKALSNIKNVQEMREGTMHNFLDLDTHINEYLTGMWINTIQYMHIVAMLENFYIPKDFSRDTIN